MLVRHLRLGRVLRFAPAVAVALSACLFLAAVFAVLASVLAGIIAE